MQLKQKIKNIIFDLGGVLVDLNEKRTIDCFGGAQISSFYTQKLSPAFVTLAHSFEKGEISADQFRNGVGNLFKLKISKAKFDRCWNAMIGDMPTHRIEMLLELKEKYRLFVLSNTNEIHVKHFVELDFWEPKLFDEVYFSNEISMRKPDKNIFEYVLSMNNLSPDETFFVDDNPENIASASDLGISTHLVNGEVLNIFQEHFDVKTKL